MYGMGEPCEAHWKVQCVCVGQLWNYYLLWKEAEQRERNKRIIGSLQWPVGAKHNIISDYGKGRGNTACS